MPKGLECILYVHVVSNALLGSGSPRLEASVKTLRTIYSIMDYQEVYDFFFPHLQYIHVVRTFGTLAI